MVSSENFDNVNPLDKIKQAKELLDMGAITEDEFNKIRVFKTN